RRYRVRIAVGSAALCLAWTLYPYVPNPEGVRLVFMNTTMNSLVFGAILLSILILPGMRVSQILSARPMRSLGNFAYSTYLFHPILLCIAFRALRHKDPTLSNGSDLVPIGVALLATLALSWISWSQFETRLIAI